MTWLEVECGLKKGTLVEHLTAAVYGLKYLFAEEANANFRNVQSIERMKILRNGFSQEAECMRKKTWVDLAEKKKFLVTSMASYLFAFASESSLTQHHHTALGGGAVRAGGAEARL